MRAHLRQLALAAAVCLLGAACYFAQAPAEARPGPRSAPSQCCERSAPRGFGGACRPGNRSVRGALSSGRSLAGPPAWRAGSCRSVVLRAEPHSGTRWVEAPTGSGNGAFLAVCFFFSHFPPAFQLEALLGAVAEQYVAQHPHTALRPGEEGQARTSGAGLVAKLEQRPGPQLDEQRPGRAGSTARRATPGQGALHKARLRGSL